MAVLLIPLVVIILFVWKDVYDSTDHSSFEDADALRGGAKIINVERKEVGTKGHRRFRTTVLFDDGFKYISHKTDVSDGFLSYRISISRELSIEILRDAIKSHELAVAKRDKKRMG